MSSDPSFDWCSFYALFWNDKGIRCKLNIPDTVLFRYGQLSAWWATNKEGYTQRHTSQSTTIEAVRRRFLQVASDDDANYSKFVAISRHGDGRPQLLRTQAFNQLCEILSDRLESGHPDECPEVETPSVLQAFIQPYQDVRYVTTLINTGANISCHTFQRKYSRRYAPMSATASAALDVREADVIMGEGSDADMRRAEVEAQMGAVEPTLKMQLRKLTAHLVRYIQRAHGLTLGGIVCEYIRDISGKIYLLSVLRTEWASNAAGRGSGSLGATNLQQVPIEDPAAAAQEFLLIQEEEEEEEEDLGRLMPPEMEVSPRTAGAGGGGAPGMEPAVAWAQPAPLSRPGTSSGLRPGTASGSPLTPTGSGGGAGVSRSGLIQYPGGGRAAGIGINVNNTWPSLQHESQLAPAAPGTTIYDGKGTTGSRTGSPTRAQSARPGPAPASNVASPMAERRGGVPRPVSSPVVRARSPNPTQKSQVGLSQVRSSSPDRQKSAVSIVTATGAHVNSGARGAPLLVQQLQKEVESLRDQLLYQHELAEASAAKIRQLEHEKEVATGAFDDRSHSLEHLLAEAREELRNMRAERDSWCARAEGAEARCAEMEAERAEMQKTLSDERATAMRALKEYQERDADRQGRTSQLEAEVSRLSEQLKTESTAVNALKRQLLEFSDIAERFKSTLNDGNLEPGMQEVLDKIGHLFNDQPNPTGEQYAVQKVLFHYHADLRSVFLYYAQLDNTFTDHWPPSLSFAQWMLFCKDSQTSDIRAGARIRSNIHFLMLHPSECESIFYRYAKADTEAASARLAGGDPLKVPSVLTYELFLAAIVHAAYKLKRPDVPYLSEALREYILRYLARAERVNPAGLKRGQVRSALEGTAKSGVAAASAIVAAGSGSNALAGYMGATSSSAPARSHSPSGASASGGANRKGSARKGSGSARKGSASGAPSPASHKGCSPSGVTSAPQIEFSKSDMANSAIMRELAMMGLDHPGSHKEIIRRGGGFDLP